MKPDVVSPISHIVVLDDDPGDSKQIRIAIEALFRKSDLPIFIEHLSNPDELLQYTAKHPDIVICDVSLDGRDDIKGLELIENYKKRYPHISFAAMTANLEQLAKLDQIEVAPEFLLPKNLLLPEVDERYGKTVVELILRNTRQNRQLEIHMPTSVESGLKKGLAWQRFDRELVHCLIRQVFSTNALPTGTAIDFESISDGRFLLPSPIIDHVELTELDEPTTGRSGSVIVNAVPKALDHANEVSVVLKFCRIEAFSEELRNFARYVKWTLPYAWRVDVLGTGISGRYGVIGYSLAFAGAAKARPMSHYLGIGDSAPVQMCIANAFDETRKVWYRNPKVVFDEVLVTQLTTRYFGPRKVRNTVIDKALENIKATGAFRAWQPSSSGGDKRLLLKRAIEGGLTRPSKAFHTCICHGDLHGGNIMVAEDNSGMVFIDFQDTGQHHVFTDFVFFENALRKDGRFAYPTDLEEAIEVERQEIGMFLSPEWPSDDVDKDLSGRTGAALSVLLIRSVRRKAILNFGSEERIHYFLHALLLTILMFKSDKLAEDSKERLSAFLIACAEQLSRRAENVDE